MSNPYKDLSILGNTFWFVMQEVLAAGLADDVYQHTGFHPSVLKLNREGLFDPDLEQCANPPAPGVQEMVLRYCLWRASDTTKPFSHFSLLPREGEALSICFDEPRTATVKIGDVVVGHVQKVVMGVAIVGSGAEASVDSTHEIVFSKRAEEESVEFFRRNGFKVSFVG